MKKIIPVLLCLLSLFATSNSFSNDNNPEENALADKVLELAKNVGWTQKECDRNFKLLQKFWLNSLNEGSLIRKHGRYFLSDPEGMQISNQVLIQMFLWWDSLDLD